MSAWKVGRDRRYKADLTHESGLVHIVQYVGCTMAHQNGWRKIVCCYYRESINKPFGYHVDPKRPYYKTLAEAKQAGEAWVERRMR